MSNDALDLLDTPKKPEEPIIQQTPPNWADDVRPKSSDPAHIARQLAKVNTKVPE